MRLALVALAFSLLEKAFRSCSPVMPGSWLWWGCSCCDQLVYAVAFWPWRHRLVLRRPALVGYLLSFGTLLVGCAPGAGGLLVPVNFYGLSLTLMAMLATGVNRLAVVGSVLLFRLRRTDRLECLRGLVQPTVRASGGG
ncbi:hypothetical protein RM788_43655 [Umezawaea sp. Da 62-37]|nr:hypothetical protein [Umezawaea sp. Da 62-37]WNV84982.1 hypothetical protein RM788_43655 [Umezawaea sp. Da 62-37]